MNTKNSHQDFHIDQNSSFIQRPCGSKNIASFSDENLYNLCKQYGERTRIWRQRFSGLLPEVFKRKLYEKKGFYSIFEFAKKLAGMSEEQVRLVLNLEKRFEEMPKLKSLLTDGKVSINKLSRIVSIAKPENEVFLATQVQVLSKSAVETLVRDEKFAEKNAVNSMEFLSKNSKVTIMDFKNQNGLQESFFGSKGLPGQICFDMEITKGNTVKMTEKSSQFGALNLSQEVQEKLLELQEKGIDVNELLKEFLQKRELEIAQKKEEISQMKKSGVNSLRTATENSSRCIPVSIKRIIYQEHGTKCSIKTCQKPSQQIHHTQRFSLSQSHNPQYLAPLCKEHHELAYSMDLAYHEIRQRNRK